MIIRNFQGISSPSYPTGTEPLLTCMASGKAILGQGIEDAKRAVACDEAGAHAEALEL